jgi:hypothetical protein
VNFSTSPSLEMPRATYEPRTKNNSEVANAQSSEENVARGEVKTV